MPYIFLPQDTAGDQCEHCDEGYYVLLVPYIFLPQDTAGDQCEHCDEGYYVLLVPYIFLPQDTAGDQCEHCGEGYYVLLVPYIFLPQDTAGDQCEHCDEGYYGDAIYKKNCKPCECDEWGSVGDTTCDSASGECTCLSDVLGDQCTECAPGTWNLTISS